MTEEKVLWINHDGNGIIQEETVYITEIDTSISLSEEETEDFVCYMKLDVLNSALSRFGLEITPLLQASINPRKTKSFYIESEKKAEIAKCFYEAGLDRIHIVGKGRMKAEVRVYEDSIECFHLPTLEHNLIEAGYTMSRIKALNFQGKYGKKWPILLVQLEWINSSEGSQPLL